jgi:hypothetical protein
MESVDFNEFLEGLYANVPPELQFDFKNFKENVQECSFERVEENDDEYMKKISKENDDQRRYDSIHNPLKLLNKEITYNLVLSSYNMIDMVIEKYNLQHDPIFLEFTFLLGFAIITGDSVELITNNLVTLVDKIIQISFETNNPYYFNVINDGIKNHNGHILSVFNCYFNK